jgi:uncharacterized protein (DUF983 family)
MNAGAFVTKLMDYYKGQYSSERIAQLRRFSDNIPEVELDRVFDAITEERSANTAITVADIKESCSRVGVSYRHSEYIVDKKVTCDACGEEYKYTPAPTEEAISRYNIHDRCPNCGFQYGWTKTMQDYAEYGNRPEWYDRYIAMFHGNGYGIGKQHGRWYNADRDKRDIDAHEKQVVQKKIDMIQKSISADSPSGT